MYLQKGTLTLVGLAGKTLPSDLSLPLAILRAVRVRGNYVGSKRHVEQGARPPQGEQGTRTNPGVQINLIYLFGACSRNILARLWMFCEKPFAVCLRMLWFSLPLPFQPYILSL